MDNIGQLNAAIYRNITGILNLKLQDTPIRGWQYEFLYLIAHYEGITQKEISQLLLVNKSTTAKAVKRLTSLGYVRKEQLQEDKRSDRLYLTEKGNLLKTRILNTVSDLLDIITSKLTTKETEQAIYLLNAILDGLLEEKERLSFNDKETPDA